MKNGINTRKLAHDILLNIYKYNLNIDDKKFSKNLNKFPQRDKNFIINICLTTMRRQFHLDCIIKKYVKKNTKIQQRILLMSAICQIVYLDFKEYAVINSSVEIAKKIKISHGFINAVLKKVSSDKKYLSDIKISYNDYPEWFKNEIKNLDLNQRKILISNFHKKPHLHIVFKSKSDFDKFEGDIVKTSEKSGFLKNDKLNIFKLDSFKNGFWWVQDLSSFIPINSFYNNLENKKILDMCAAPGGKSFQAISANGEVFSNDKNKSRVKILEKNLIRLNLNAKILNMDATNLKVNEKFDLIIIDAPCSAIGTVRRNPEIFFKSKKPDISNLIKIQQELLDASKIHLKNNGYILYMVCSFLYSETLSNINNFLLENKNFSLLNIKIPQKLLKNFKTANYFLTLPADYNGFNFDGYFAAIMVKKS